MAFVPKLEYQYLIGFRSAEDDLEHTDKYFEYFRHANADDITINGTGFFITKDGTKVKKIYSNVENELEQFDQYILADNLHGNISRLRQNYLTEGIVWTYKIPEEYRIQYCDIKG